MEWLAENWLWVLIGIVFIVMHMFGHGGHGGHDGPGRLDDNEGENKKRNSQTHNDSGHPHH